MRCSITKRVNQPDRRCKYKPATTVDYLIKAFEKPYIGVDTIDFLLEVAVHAANIQDRDEAKVVLEKLSPDTKKCLKKLWVDGAYRGQLVKWVRKNIKAVLEIVERDPGVKGFKVVPYRWVVERTFAWLGRCRRLSKDYERNTASSEAFIDWASIRLLLSRCVK